VIPVEIGNEAVRNGTLAKRIESIPGDLKPETAYFVEENGSRTAHVFCELKDESHIPTIAEPWFLVFNARVGFHPAIKAEDLKKAAPHLEQAAKKYGAPLAVAAH
jgi:hypothetical protein